MKHILIALGIMSLLIASIGSAFAISDDFVSDNQNEIVVVDTDDEPTREGQLVAPAEESESFEWAKVNKRFEDRPDDFCVIVAGRLCTEPPGDPELPLPPGED